MADLEAAALSGDLFRPRSDSPTRSESTSSPLNTDDELGSDLSRPSSPHGSNANLLSQPSQPSAAAPSHSGAQTGPKGVISDRRAQRSQAREDGERDRRAVRAEQERRTIVAETVEQERVRREKEERDREAWEREREREEEENRLKWRRQRREELERERGGGERAGEAALKRGGLREVGKEGVLMAVERPGWVVILIYEPVRAGRTGCRAIIGTERCVSRIYPGAKSSSLTCFISHSTSHRHLPLSPSSGQEPRLFRSPCSLPRSPVRLEETPQMTTTTRRTNTKTSRNRRADPTRMSCPPSWRIGMESSRGGG
jgi:hypothetical protein